MNILDLHNTFFNRCIFKLTNSLQQTYKITQLPQIFFDKVVSLKYQIYFQLQYIFSNCL